MHWYLLHTKPRQEALALQQLQQQGYPCYLPTLRVEKVRQGALVVVQEPLFPRYLFIQLGEEASARSWGPVRSTRGVSKLVMFGQHPARVDDALVAALQAREAAQQATPERRFAPGDRVQFLDGPFAGVEGVYQQPDGERRVMVLIELLSRPVQVPVPVGNLRRVG